jgi:DNA-binding transcriptional ArsR family regulator
MLEQSEALDLAFHALSDSTRRALVSRLTAGPASVSDLAKPFDATLASIVQHIQVLEASGLIITEKVGRTRTCRISADAVARVEGWLNERRRTWESNFDRLGALLESAAPSRAATAKTHRKRHRRPRP